MNFVQWRVSLAKTIISFSKHRCLIRGWSTCKQCFNHATAQLWLLMWSHTAILVNYGVVRPLNFTHKAHSPFKLTLLTFPSWRNKENLTFSEGRLRKKNCIKGFITESFFLNLDGSTNSGADRLTVELLCKNREQCQEANGKITIKPCFGRHARGAEVIYCVLHNSWHFGKRQSWMPHIRKAS